MAKPLKDYSGRCGSCEHFAYHVVNGELVRFGNCECARRDWFHHNNRRGSIYLARHSRYRNASDKACRKYKDGR